MGKLNEIPPDTIGGFATLFPSVMKDGTLSLRDKELIALAIAVHATCAPCIRLHVRKCLDAGATRDQMIEEVSVAVMIGSGPAYL